MMSEKISRRKMMKASAAVAAAGVTAGCDVNVHVKTSQDQFVYCLNTSTIRGQALGIVREIEVAAEAGYSAIEPWVRSIEAYLAEGGTLKELKQRIDDAGLTVESAIAFSQWIVDDEAVRHAALEQAKREMDMLAQIGGKRMAAPPSGATDKPGLDLRKAAERYRALLEIGDETGVVPMVEVWGFSANLHLLGQSAFVAIESGHPKACILPDVYHLYKGGSTFEGLKLFGKAGIPAFHINDYPADPPRETISDKDRVMPGEGAAPLGGIIRDLHAINPEMVLSLELFNPEYWKRDALQVAKEGLEKMKTMAAASLA